MDHQMMRKTVYLPNCKDDERSTEDVNSNAKNSKNYEKFHSLSGVSISKFAMGRNNESKISLDSIEKTKMKQRKTITSSLMLKTHSHMKVSQAQAPNQRKKNNLCWEDYDEEKAARPMRRLSFVCKEKNESESKESKPENSTPHNCGSIPNECDSTTNGNNLDGEQYLMKTGCESDRSIKMIETILREISEQIRILLSSLQKNSQKQKIEQSLQIFTNKLMEKDLSLKAIGEKSRQLRESICTSPQGHDKHMNQIFPWTHQSTHIDSANSHGSKLFELQKECSTQNPIISLSRMKFSESKAQKYFQQKIKQQKKQTFSSRNKHIIDWNTYIKTNNKSQFTGKRSNSSISHMNNQEKFKGFNQTINKMKKMLI